MPILRRNRGREAQLEADQAASRRAPGRGINRSVVLSRQRARETGLAAERRGLDAVAATGGPNSRERLLSRTRLVDALEARLGAVPDADRAIGLQTGARTTFAVGGGMGRALAAQERSRTRDRDLALRSGEAGQIVLQATALRRALAGEIEGRGSISGFRANRDLLNRVDAILGAFGAEAFAGSMRSPLRDSNDARMNRIADRRQLEVDAGVNRQAAANRRSLASRRNAQIEPQSSTLRRRANTLLIPMRSRTREGVLS